MSATAVQISDRLTSDLAHEMRRRWRSGAQVRAEELLARYPELAAYPEIAIDLIYEEYCLRQSAGQSDVEQEILGRYPRWAGPLRVMLDCHRALQGEQDVVRLPAVGEKLGDFRIETELASGARGRVYLATQANLADRKVVLKLTPLDGGEHLSLARLQHTNIVPIHWAIDHPTRNLRVLCMPYFGRATLASVLELLKEVPFSERTGRQICDAVDAQCDRSDQHFDSAARQMLASVSYVQAVCWIGAALADALQFAHERNLLHLDLKPSNILLASDGQPMLLDFHLARGPVEAGGAMPENFGGTPPYMPPEQLAAMRSLADGKPSAVSVDGRADIYALGAILLESLGGRANPAVSIGLCDILAKCTAQDPRDRYASAATLAEDLRRHITDQPLAGVPNRALAERWDKWRRRKPAMLRTIALLLLIGGAGAILLTSAWSGMHERAQQAQLFLRDGQRQIQIPGHAAEAVRSLERGLDLAQGAAFERSLRGELRDALEQARLADLRERFHRLAEEVRPLYGQVGEIPSDRREQLFAGCDGFLQKQQIGAAAAREDLFDIAIFAAELRPEMAMGMLLRAEEIAGPSIVLEQERKNRDPAYMPRKLPPPSTPWEHFALGRALLECNDLSSAAAELNSAVHLAPADRWANFYFALCSYRTSRFEDAISALSVCIGSDPTVATFYYNRALARVALGKPQQAADDCERALQLDPRLDAARMLKSQLQVK